MAFIYDLVDTWNDGATTFAGIKLNVTDTASAAASLLMDLQVGGVSRFSISKAGVLSFGAASGAQTLQSNGTGALSIYSGGASRTVNLAFGHANFSTDGIIAASDIFIGFTNNTNAEAGTRDVTLFRDAADTLAQRRGTNPQAFRLYNTFTDASNYERVRMQWSGNVFSIAPEAAGTGTVRVIHISGLPTSNPGPGILWNNAGTPAIGT
jgi:hypothetical protein